jgi:glucans biosynthesis protein
MTLSPRCGARTRGGDACRAPAVSGRARCRMHGGAVGSGAPRGNQNALKSGLHTAEARAELGRARANMRETWALLGDL